MSDAMYECALGGLRLRQFEERAGAPGVLHVVFLDGKDQWSSRKSDLKRFIDLFHQGLIDYLFRTRSRNGVAKFVALRLSVKYFSVLRCASHYVLRNAVGGQRLLESS